MSQADCNTSDTAKIMLGLAFIADLGYNTEESSCQTAGAIRTQIDAALLELKEKTSGWVNYELVWGPYVYKFPLLAKTRDNTVYIAQNQNVKSQYVLAIAGTNPCEIWDWIFEDFIVGPQVRWIYGSAPSTAKVSLSAAFSLGIVQNARPCADLPSHGQRVKTYLASQAAGGKIEVVVTGHSLGGEMASTVALWLADTQGPQHIKSEQWDPNNNATVSAYTFAGPTAGNAEWAAYFDSRLGDRTCRIWNSMDIVPHAWNINDLKKLPDLYLSGGITMPQDLQDGLEVVELLLAKSGYTQINEAQTPLEGTVNAALTNYLTQALYQHTQAYADLLGLPPHAANKIVCPQIELALE